MEEKRLRLWVLGVKRLVGLDWSGLDRIGFGGLS